MYYWSFWLVVATTLPQLFNIVVNRNIAILNIVVKLLRNIIILIATMLKERNCKKDMIIVIDFKATNYYFARKDDFIEYIVFIRLAF